MKMSKPILPSYKQGDKEIVVQMLETIELTEINSLNERTTFIRYKQSVKYKLYSWMAYELNEDGSCWFIEKTK